MSFSIHPEILQYKTFAEFAAEHECTEKDLIFTNEFIYDPFMKPCGVPCKTIFQEKYGKGEPSDEMIDAIRSDMPEGLNRIIAVGGGTVIDIAKVLIHSGSWETESIFMGSEIPEKKMELIVIPTTCGTGSEMTNIAVVELKRQHTKKGLALPTMYPDKAVLIPEMIQTLPYQFFATSSIDAMIHAIESYVSPKANSYTELFSEKAIQLIINGYRHVAAEGKESWTDCAEEFLTASNYAGIAFGNAGCGAVHAMSYPLGGTYHIPHGEANMLMFMEVFRKYREKKPVGKLNAMEELLGRALNVPAEESFEALDSLLQQILPCKRLHEYGIREEELPVFTKSVIEGQQRLLNNNYVPLDEEDMMNIYRNRY